jgi:hypothetical protein
VFGNHIHAVSSHNAIGEAFFDGNIGFGGNVKREVRNSEATPRDFVQNSELTLPKFGVGGKCRDWVARLECHIDKARAAGNANAGVGGVARVAVRAGIGGQHDLNGLDTRSTALEFPVCNACNDF